MFLQKGIYIDDDNSSSDISPLDLTGGTPDDDNRKQKKIRPSNSCENLTPTSQLLAPAKNLIDNTDRYPVSIDKVVEFMNKAAGDNDILKLTRSYTIDIYFIRGRLHKRKSNLNPGKSVI
ncbi:hypothetical protein Zmor_023858 [Zophobas morio]|uniref:Uncharacterized protein n=1 Tax=Zophobas morio TaxID=2755281 RepID=A0AA38HZC6_9CUCU|nr:hypothetical protein Zmor_023858 [Zophobas morio]